MCGIYSMVLQMSGNKERGKSVRIMMVREHFVEKVKWGTRLWMERKIIRQGKGHEQKHCETEMSNRAVHGYRK